MPRTVEKNRAGGTWSNARYFSFIRSLLRRGFMKYPVKFQVKNEASRPYKGSDKRRKKEYQCAVCEGWFPDKEVAVDHIEPCGSLKSYEDLPKFVATLFCEKENLQIVCNECHQQKSNREREERAKR